MIIWSRMFLASGQILDYAAPSKYGPRGLEGGGTPDRRWRASGTKWPIKRARAMVRNSAEPTRLFPQGSGVSAINSAGNGRSNRPNHAVVDRLPTHQVMRADFGSPANSWPELWSVLPLAGLSTACSGSR